LGLASTITPGSAEFWMACSGDVSVAEAEAEAG